MIVLLCAIPVMYLLTRLLDRDWDRTFREAALNKGAANETSGAIRFEEPDYDLDIFEDEIYLDKNRYITYTEGAVSQLITENHSAYGVGPEFFGRYFSAVINGDSDTLNSLLTDDFIKENEAYGRFTMQKIYDITVEKLSENVIESGEYKGVKQYTYRVAYKIMNNNGTFRSDMESDAAVPVIFELLDDGQGPLLNSISKYTYAK